jgi:hypothetical protein
MTEKPFPLIVGCGRSGTTLLRNILHTHSKLAVAHEAHFLAPMARDRAKYTVAGSFDIGSFLTDLLADPNFRRQGLDEAVLRQTLESAAPEDFSAAVRVVYGSYARAHGDKPYYGDKTPGYVKHIPLLAKLFPEASFIHIIRDGRDVALAYIERDEWGPRTVAEAALYWDARVREGRTAGEQLGSGRYHEIKYEDLVEHPEEVLRQICRFLGLDFEPSMLSFHEQGDRFAATTATPDAFTKLALPVTKGLRDWRAQMDRADVALFEALSGDLIEDLGYGHADVVLSASTRVKALIARVGWTTRRARVKLGLRPRASS